MKVENSYIFYSTLGDSKIFYIKLLVKLDLVNLIPNWYNIHTIDILITLTQILTWELKKKLKIRTEIDNEGHRKNLGLTLDLCRINST